MSDREYGQLYRYGHGGSSRRAYLFAVGGAAAVQRENDREEIERLRERRATEPAQPRPGYQVQDEDGGEWHAVSRDDLLARLDHYDIDKAIALDLLKAGKHIRLGQRRYRWTDGD